MKRFKANSPAPTLVPFESEEALQREWVRSSTIKAGLAKRVPIDKLLPVPDAYLHACRIPTDLLLAFRCTSF